MKTFSRLLPGALALAIALPLQAQTDDAARVGALREALVQLDARARELEDTLAIHRLQRAFGYYIDKGYWDEAAALFADSAEFEIASDGVYRGPARIRELLARHGGGNLARGPGLPFGRMNRHMQLQPLVSIDGDEAQARWRDLSLLGQYEQDAFWGDAVMENRYVREDGVWKIAAVRLYPNFLAPYEGGWAALRPVEGDWSTPVAKDFPPDAPPSVSYRPFPELFTPPFHYENPAQAPARPALALPEPGPGPLGELETRLAEHAAELDNLAAERDIERLQAAYGYYIDKGLWDEAAALFSEDASYEFGQGGVYRGRARIRQALGLMGPEGLQPGQLNNYPMLQPIITVAEDYASAKARWRSDVMLAKDGKGRWGGGVYENEYVKEDGRWKIGKLHYYVTFWADYDAGWPAGLQPMDGPSAELPPDAPPTEIYESQPGVHLFPFSYPHLVTGEAHKGDAGARAAQEAGEASGSSGAGR